MARQSARGDRPRPGHLQGGSRLWPRPPYKGATDYGQGSLHRVRPVAASPQGRQLLTGTAACSTTPARGSPSGQGCH
ncbi:hypothetical protein BHE74_00009027 [Ensete ventricosum]|nr:hypothetical protein BHE74_00009027 [Ensete ventricosum]